MQYEGLYFKVVPKHFIFFLRRCTLRLSPTTFLPPAGNCAYAEASNDARCLRRREEMLSWKAGRHPTLEGDGRSRAQEKEVAAAMAL